MELSKISSKPLHEVMPIVQLQVALQLCNIDVAVPYIVGAPGGAKTAFINKMCREAGWNLAAVHFALNPIEEIGGLPLFNKVEFNGKQIDGTSWSLPDMLSKLYEIASNGKPTVFFLDDYHLCSPGHMSLGFEMFTERKLRGFKIPDNVGFVLAGNSSSKAGAKTIFSAIVNRCAMFPTHLSFDYWKENYALKSGEEIMNLKTADVPVDMSAIMAKALSGVENGISPKIVSFLSNEKYQKYFHEDEQVSQSWSSPRSWSRLSNMLVAMTAVNGNLTLDEILYVAGGHVSNEAASDYAQYDLFFAKLELDKVFDDRKPIDIPSNMADRYIYIMASVAEFMSRLTIANRTETQKESKDIQLKARDKMSEIIHKMGLTAVELAVAGLKEIVINEKALKFKSSYPHIDKWLSNKDPEIYKKISYDIGVL